MAASFRMYIFHQRNIMMIEYMRAALIKAGLPTRLMGTGSAIREALSYKTRISHQRDLGVKVKAYITCARVAPPPSPRPLQIAPRKAHQRAQASWKA